MMAMQYREIEVPKALSPYVRCVWRLAGSDEQGTPEPVIPDGCAEIVLHGGEQFQQHDGAGLTFLQPRELVVGQITRAIRLQPTGRVDVWGIRLQPWALGTFFPGMALELRDESCELAVVAPRFRNNLLRAIHDPMSGRREPMVMAAIERHLGSRKNVGVSAAAALAQRASATRMHGTVASLATFSGLGVRRVQMIFRNDVGLSPKQYLRITRFQTAVRMARGPGSASWANIAAQAGYYDQGTFSMTRARFLAGRRRSCSAVWGR
jgi:AraC-like DNA-binding protein